MGTGGSSVKRADKKVDPEKVFRALLKQEGIPQPKSEHKFALNGRRWRFDYAWLDPLVALEVEGGIWVRGRHSRGAGMLSDMDKYNHAALTGWTVLRTTPDGLSTKKTIELLRDALVWPKRENGMIAQPDRDT